MQNPRGLGLSMNPVFLEDQSLSSRIQIQTSQRFLQVNGSDKGAKWEVLLYFMLAMGSMNPFFPVRDLQQTH